ncbi:AAA family ATPase [Pseudarthrobacter sp. ATCC 49987]|uniref:AAA family ATPase n=1 Tax=Pseudarthrobacter sp. ATCC 49987 TaxID=2698204 RepID=UPI00136A573B|nr:ATP-binding protein [Pseudarthrobacter sp. ATCC 49987]
MAERLRTGTGQPTVHLLCGLPGAGKTTVARQLEAGLPAVRFSLDEWMLRLYPELHFASADYGELAESCKLLIWDTALQVLQAGTDVVLDWNQWNSGRRAVWAAKAEAAGAAVVLHYVRTPLEAAIERAVSRAGRGEAGSHRLGEDDVRHLAGIFEEPEPSEGLRILP